MSRRRLTLLLLLTLIASSLTIAARDHQAASSEPLAWQAATGPFTGNVKLFAESGLGTLFAWVQGEVFRSRDDGGTWLRCESQPGVYRGADPWMFTAGRRLYVMNDPGRTMYVSDDDCSSSRAIAAPAVDRASGEVVTHVGGVLLAGYHGPALFASPDEGRTWTRVDVPPGTQLRVAAHGTEAYVIVSQRLYHSADRGTTWAALGAGDLRFSYLITGGGDLFGAGLGGLLRSSDRGRTWTSVIRPPFTAATACNTNVYVAAFDRIARSADEGTTWTGIPLPIQGHTAFALHETRRGTLLAGTATGIFRWNQTGGRWTATGVGGARVRGLAAHRGRAYAGLVGGTFWRSEDAGLTWSRVDTSFSGTRRPLGGPASAFTRLFPAEDGTLHASTDRELISSKDGGRTWMAAGLDHGVNALVRSGDSWYAATFQGVFRSGDFVEWRECSSGLQDPAARALTVTTEGDLIAYAGGGLFRSTDGCQSWWPIAGHPPVHSAQDSYSEPRPMLFSDPKIGIVLVGDGISQLNLQDRKWVPRAALPVITDAVRDGLGRYWLGSREGVWRLDIVGEEWRLARQGLEGAVSALAVEPDGYLLAAVEGRGIFRARVR